MTPTLVLHPRTERASQQFLKNPSHSLLLVGPMGAGKRTLALHMISQLLQVEVAKLTEHPQFLLLAPDRSSISIETVRQAQAFVRLRTTGDQTWRRAILVEDAHTMTTEAQNAFLKLLEEPPSDTVIILTATSPTDLLPTITSRAPKITVHGLDQASLEQYFADQPVGDVTKSYHMSGGQVGFMHRLLDDEQNQTLLAAIADAKQFLQMPSFERLVFVDQFLKAKREVPEFLWALLTVAKAVLHQAGRTENTATTKRWQKAITAILAAQDALPAHPLPKLMLTDLSLNL